MPGDLPANSSLLGILGLTVRRLFCILSESVFLIGGIVIGFAVMPDLRDAMEEHQFDPGPLAHGLIDWYWVLLAVLAAHILLWPIVPRVLGWFGVALWWALGVALPLLVVAAPALFVLSAYAGLVRDL